MNEIKNKNLFIRVSEKEKNLIERNAERCGLTVSEYLRQRALGYMPRAVLPEVFFSFNDKLDALCVVCEGKISVDTEEKIISLIDEITAELKSKETLRKHYIHPALEMGLIVMCNPDKPTSRNQAYMKK